MREINPWQKFPAKLAHYNRDIASTPLDERQEKIARYFFLAGAQYQVECDNLNARDNSSIFTPPQVTKLGTDETLPKVLSKYQDDTGTPLAQTDEHIARYFLEAGINVTTDILVEDNSRNFFSLLLVFAVMFLGLLLI